MELYKIYSISEDAIIDENLSYDEAINFYGSEEGCVVMNQDGSVSVVVEHLKQYLTHEAREIRLGGGLTQ